MLKAAIFEDEIIYLETIKAHISKYIPEPDQVFTFRTAEEITAFQETPSGDFDLVIMDIHPGNQSGIQLARDISSRNRAAQIIFTSHFSDYVSDIYETDHIYFIYKQNLNEYLPKAIRRALKNLELLKKEYYDFTWNREHYRVAMPSILYMERILRTTEVHTHCMTYKTSEKFNDCLPKLNENFAVCHRSYLVNVQHISALEPHYVVLGDDIRIPLSRRYADDIQKKFAKLLL